MTFKAWREDYEKRRDKVLEKLFGSTKEQVVDYFMYDNMVKNEQDFCPLYEAGAKCHNMDNLNCYYCACPFFVASDDEPLEILEDGFEVMSKCAVNSKFAFAYTSKDQKQQCDCTNCKLPHRKIFIMKEEEYANLL